MNDRTERTGNGAVWNLMVAAAALLGFIAPVTFAAAQAQNLVGNGGFEAPKVQNAAKYDLLLAGSTRLAPWVIGGHSIDHVGAFWKAAEGTQSLDLDGTAAGAISQEIATIAGRTYKLRFQYSAHPDRGSNIPKMTVRFGPKGNTTYDLQASYTFPGKSQKNNMGWITVERTFTASQSGPSVLSFTSDDVQNPYGIALDDVSLTLEPLPYQFSTPALIRAYAVATPNPYGSVAGTYVIGRVDGAANQALTIQAYTGSTCTAGVLGGGGTAFGSPVAPIEPKATPGKTDANGYFAAFVPGVASGTFITVAVATPTTTSQSACLVASAENDNWPKALAIDGALQASDFIDGPGRARWYKFKALPDQRIRVLLSGLPADYDVAVFRDIEGTFLELLGVTGTAAVTRLSAEYAPSTFSPSTFSPSTFSPSTFSPDAYSPDAFAPSTFSPDVYSPSTFSPSTFSPSTFSPSTFSPSTFSPSTFSPSTFSPSTFSPSTFSPAGFDTTELERAFSSAQTRSMIGVSATPGPVDETVVVNSWNNTGNFYVRVASRGGSYSTAGRFSLNVTKDASSCPADLVYPPITARSPEAGGVRTVILTDSTKLPGVASGQPLRAKLDAFAQRSDIGGVVRDVAADPGVSAKRTIADANPSCPFAKNLLAEEIKGIVDAYRPNNSGLRYVVIVGGDGVVPFFRYPDQSLLGQESGYVPPVLDTSASQASLRRDFVLGQDAYGAGTRVSIRSTRFPVPGLAVGRLVETEAEIAGMLDAYTSVNGAAVVPGSSLVTGYDFLEDAANGVGAELRAGIGGTKHTALITPNGVSPQDSRSWTATQLGDALFSSRHDVIFLAGHFSANSALAADFATSLLTTELEASTVDLKNAIVFSAGCHSGYNLVDGDKIDGVTQPLDWAQAFARKQATLIAGTGYQYGDTDFIEYSERLYQNFSRQLRAGTGPVAVGEALVKAKLEYLEATPDVRGLHEKSLLEAALFGLPMTSVNMPGTRYTPPAAGTTVATTAVGTNPGLVLGLQIADRQIPVAGTLTQKTLELDNLEIVGGTVLATWLTGPAGVVTNPAEPALPLMVESVTPANAGLVLRGVGFREGNYSDRTVVALTGAPTTELRGVHVPFVSPVFFPMRLWTPNYFGALAGAGGTSLLVTPAQHRALDILAGTSTLREYSALKVRLFYSGDNVAATSDAPTIVSVSTRELVAGTITFSAQVVGDPKAGIQQVWILHTTGPGSNGVGQWLPLDLAQCIRATPGSALPSGCSVEDSQLWAAQLPVPATPASFRYIVQAASGTGLVTLDDNRGLYYSLAGAADVLTTLVFSPAPSGSAAYGANVAVSARLTTDSPAPGTPVAGKQVILAVGSAARIVTTDANGIASAQVPVVTRPGVSNVIASFAGDDKLLPSAVSAQFTVNQAISALSAFQPIAVGPAGFPTYQTELTAALGLDTQRLLQEAIEFRLSQGGTLKQRVYVNTDYLGRVALPPTGLPAGTYDLQAKFAGNATYSAASQTLQFTISTPELVYGGTPPPDSLTLGSSVTFTVTSTSGQPVLVGLGTGSSAFCSLTANANGSYTLAGIAAGACQLVISVAGTVTFASVDITQTIEIVKKTQTIDLTGFTAKNPLTFGQTDTYPATTNAGQTIAWSATGPCSFGANSLPPNVLSAASGTGTCTIGASAPETTEYAAYSNPTFGTITLAKATQSVATLTATPATTVVGQATFQVDATTAPSGRTVTFTSATGGKCTIGATTTSTATVNIVAAGTCSIVATLAADTSYETASRTLDVTILAQQTISYVPAPLTFGTPQTFPLTTDAPASQPITWTASAPCAFAGNVLSTTSAIGGPCTIGASALAVSGYVAYNNPAYASISLVKASQTIAFANPGPKLAADPPFAITATASSGLKVDFTASGACTVSASTLTGTVSTANVTLTGTGNCTIAASQAGNDGYAPATASQTFAITAGTFTSAGTMTQPRSHHTATLLCDGTILAAGGLDARGQSTATAELYRHGATPLWAAVGNLPSKSAGHAAVLVGIKAGNKGDPCLVPADTRVYVTGGGNSSTQIYDPVTKTWSAGGGLSSGRSYHTATRLLDGRVLIVGGSDNSGKTAGDTLIYDPVTQSVVTGPPLAFPRERHTATLLSSGEVLIAGGRATVAGVTAPVKATEIYDPLLGRFVATDPLDEVTSGRGRFDHRAERLGSGTTDERVLVVGGNDGSVNLSTAWIYDAPASDTWVPTGNLVGARREAGVARLGSSAVLVTGGRGPTPGEAPLKSAEIFVTSGFSALPAMAKERYAHTATAFTCSSGTGTTTCVLITGGVGSGNKSIADAEVYK